MYDQAAADWQRIAEERERQLRAQAEILRHTKQELEAARLVCVLFGWTASAGDSDEDKAVAQAWHDWANTYGAISPTPEWRARVKELARRRDEIRQRTLASIRGARSAEERSDEHPNALDREAAWDRYVARLDAAERLAEGDSSKDLQTAPEEK